MAKQHKTLGEASGKFYMPVTQTDDLLDINNLIAKRKQEEQEQDLKSRLIEAEKLKQEEINQKLETLEVIPNGSRVVLQPYPVNPYRKIMEGNIFVDYQGEFKNPDTGEQDKMKEFVGCAKIIEIGPLCEYVKVGDDVYYDTRQVYPLPFMSLGYRIIHEQNLLCIINEKLKERFKMN